MLRYYNLLLFNCFFVVATFSTQEFASYWKELSKDYLNARFQPKNEKKAKNVIFFLGDGMGLSTVTAARIHRGQTERRENNQQPFRFETFPYAGLVKTYSYNYHVTDSAAGATALFTGSKVNSHTIGVDAGIQRNECNRSIDNHKLRTVAEKAIANGLSAGFVTTTAITHGTPAALYAHSASRWAQSDADNKLYNYSEIGCPDIAKQLMDHFPGNQFKVMLGGGRQHFYPDTTADVENSNNFGRRMDGRNLIEEWKKTHGYKGTYVWNRQQLLDVDFDNTEFLTGMFDKDHMMFELERLENDTSNPTLAEMTQAAIKILSKDPNGYYLLVEGGRIDHALHKNLGKMALTEVIEFDKAIQMAREMTDSEDTLIIVTADHSHPLTLPGYMTRDKSILGYGIAEYGNVDNLPYTGLLFANGPSGLKHANATDFSRRRNLTGIDTEDAHFTQPTFIPMDVSTHGGEDVGIWADGPQSYLFTGTMENVYIAHAIDYALCLSNGTNACSPSRHSADPWEFQQVLLIVTTLFSSASFVLLCILIVLVLHSQRKERTKQGVSSN